MWNNHICNEIMSPLKNDQIECYKKLQRLYFVMICYYSLLNPHSSLLSNRLNVTEKCHMLRPILTCFEEVKNLKKKKKLN